MQIQNKYMNSSVKKLNSNGLPKYYFVLWLGAHARREGKSKFVSSLVMHGVTNSDSWDIENSDGNFYSEITIADSATFFGQQGGGRHPGGGLCSERHQQSGEGVEAGVGRQVVGVHQHKQVVGGEPPGDRPQGVARRHEVRQ